MPIGVYNGNWKNGWRRFREDVQTQEDRQVFIIAHNRNRFSFSLEKLKTADPGGWEVWYDDDANIPPSISWLDSSLITELCHRIELRAERRSSIPGGAAIVER